MQFPVRGCHGISGDRCGNSFGGMNCVVSSVSSSDVFLFKFKESEGGEFLFYFFISFDW